MSLEEKKHYSDAVREFSISRAGRKMFREKLAESCAFLKEIEDYCKSLREWQRKGPDTQIARETADVLIHVLTLTSEQAREDSLTLFKRVFPEEYEEKRLLHEERKMEMRTIGIVKESLFSRALKQKLKWDRLVTGKKEFMGNFDVPRLKEIPFDSVAILDGLKSKGALISVALCPFHAERSPSFTIYQNDNHAHCYGCEWHGDVINFRQELYSESFQEACKFLTTLV